MSDDILWQPSDERMQASGLWAFATATKDQHGCATDDYPGILRWSIAAPEGFHQALWDFLDIIGDKGDVAFLAGDTLRQTKFFPNAKLNYAENLLRDADDRLAVIAHRDDGTRREITRRQLYDRVSQIVAALRAEGVVPGDRVGAIVTNDLEALEAYLAVAAVGAVWASCSPDFGPQGASDRLTQIAPKVLMAVPSYRYGDKHIDITETINAVAETDAVTRIVLLGEAPAEAAYGKPSISLEAWLAPYAPNDISFERGAFDAPLVILFSSGTTGKPKCIVHGAGNLLLQHMKEMRLHCDIGVDDRLFYFTTCGWMMWNWQVSGLAVGATLVTYDGNPFYPEASRLIDLVDAERISVFGTSAKYIDACSKAGLTPRVSHDFGSLRAVLSTGSPLLPENFDYVYRDWKADLHLASISGGTDICACFLGGAPVLPVRRGELQCALLGMDVDTLDDTGTPIMEVPGEFVCRNAHLSMPVAFWHDDDGQRYHDAYFARFEGIWAHGDFVEKRRSGGYIIHGRSDTTLNPGGVRIGTAEIYRQVETVDSVLEALAVGQTVAGDQRVILFVRLRDGVVLDDALQKLIKARIRAGATPRHVPAMIVAVPDIPRTRSGKISEIAVRDVIDGRVLKNIGALANADCLAFYKEWAASVAGA